MLGIVFTEFTDFVEDSFSADMFDDIINDSSLKSDGAYTAVGVYDHKEIVALVVALSKRSQLPVDDLVKAFGIHLFKRFTALYPIFFDGVTDSFNFLKQVDQHIHVEVKKLYPNAKLPRVIAEEINSTTLTLTYTSTRPFGNLAKGLIEGALEFFGDDATLSMEDQSSDQGSRVIFTITRNKEFP